MRRVLIFVLFVFGVVATGFAQEWLSSDNWSGEVVVEGLRVNICFSVRSVADGRQICTMGVPEQGAKDIPAELIRYDSDSLSISVAGLRVVCRGRRISQDRVEGVFTQNGLVVPVTLVRGGDFVLRRPQTPLPPFEYATEDIIFHNEAEGAALSGTLTYPIGYENCAEKSVPVVLFVSGSGGQDRNEELFGHKPFLVLADFLAKHGIASLRYDDRGVGRSTGPTAGTTTMNNLADAEAGVAFLRSLDKFGKIGVLGHSEGGTIAFMMGANGSVDFLVSLAGTAVKGTDVIIGQNRAIMRLQGIPQGVIDDYATALGVVYGDRVAGVHIANGAEYIAGVCRANGLLLPDNLKKNLEQCAVQGGEWFSWFLGYNPAEAIGRISCPVMALNGALDCQVLSGDNLPVIEKNLPEDNRNFIKEYESLNHFFQNCTPATAISYGAIEETISKAVLEDIVRWINTNFRD